MRIIATIFLSLLAVGLQACAPARLATAEDIKPTTITAPPCVFKPGDLSPGDCVIELRVTPFEAKSCAIELGVRKPVVGVPGTFFFEPQPNLDLVSFDPSNGPTIYWRIFGDVGYVFTHDGIAFVDNFKPRVFRDGQRISDTEFQWKMRKNVKRRVNGYVINVKGPADRECELDPWIRNRN